MNDLEELVRNILNKNVSVTVPKIEKQQKQPKEAETGSAPYLHSNSISNVATFVSYEDVEIDLTEKLKKSDVVLETDLESQVRLILRKKTDRINLTETSEPSKKAVRQAVSTRKMTPTNRVFKGMPGDSRNVMVDAIKAIAAEHTGCITADHVIHDVPMKSTTARGDGNIIAGYQVVTDGPHR
jgi:hypothetical protein